MEPPPSVPSANGVMPAATLAAAPQLDPPAVFVRSQGFRVTPVRGESPTALQPNSLVVVLPTMQAPAALIRSTDGASLTATFSAIAFEPKVWRTPPTAIRSLTEIGSPWSGPSRSPLITACSARRAFSKAILGVSVAKQFSVGSRASMRSNTSFSSSTGEIADRTNFEQGCIVGHENLGVVEEVGPAVERIKPGDWVCLPFNISCGHCKNCERGLTAFYLSANQPGIAGGAFGFAGMGPCRADKPSIFGYLGRTSCP